ncbi:hypothetical protein GYMLUDRAFT_236016 [Collybiopsis luxurians FD-317 M1]|nr:hypothetical protein GYMLUDRAFT_236016 [Collybiopsis luxurians FD-317 M1]
MDSVLPVRKSELNVALGTAPFGEKGKANVQVHDLKIIDEILNGFRAYGRTELCKYFGF